jgi:hypothetical protein
MLPAFLARLLVARGRAAHSPKGGEMKARTFSGSFRRKYDELKSADEPCILQHHYRGWLREVIGLLDLWARNDPERFVALYGGVDAVVQCCHWYQQPKKHPSKSMVEKVLKELRSRYIISKPLIRVRDGVECVGFIVTPHDYLAQRQTPTTCVLKGQLKTAGRWKRDPVLEATGKWTGKFGPVYAYCAVECTAPSTVESTAKCAVECTEECTVADLALNVATSNDCAENRAVTVLTESVVGTERAVQTVRTGFDAARTGQVEIETAKVQTKPQTNTEGLSSSSTTVTDQKQNPETIAQHFASGGVDMNDITDGLFEETEQSEHFDEVDVKTLLQICDAVIQDFGQRRYLGRKTHGDIMAEAMVRFTKKYGQNVPLYWYPIAKQLRASAGKHHSVRELSVSTTAAVREMAREIATRPPCPDCGAKHPMPPCGNRVAPYQPLDHKKEPITRE